MLCELGEGTLTVAMLPDGGRAAVETVCPIALGVEDQLFAADFFGQHVFASGFGKLRPRLCFCAHRLPSSARDFEIRRCGAFFILAP
jgi:hypothetical protein